MRKSPIIALATATLAAASLAAAIPAAEAQPVVRHDNAWHDSAWRMTPARNAEIRRDINQLDRQIDRAAARRTISRREASGLRVKSRNVQRLYASYARNGLSRGEVMALQERVNNIREALRIERADWNGHRG